MDKCLYLRTAEYLHMPRWPVDGTCLPHRRLTSVYLYLYDKYFYLYYKYLYLYYKYWNKYRTCTTSAFECRRGGAVR